MAKKLQSPRGSVPAHVASSGLIPLDKLPRGHTSTKMTGYYTRSSLDRLSTLAVRKRDEE
jgi:hypothetical protein